MPKVARAISIASLTILVICQGLLAFEPTWWDRAWTKRLAVLLPADTEGLVRVRWPADARSDEIRCVPVGAHDPIPHWAQWIELSPARRVAESPTVHYGFPRVVRARSGQLLLFYRVGRAHAQGDSYIAQRTSNDHGDTWSDETHVWQAPSGTSAHNPVAIVTASGRVLLWMSRYVYSAKGHERQPCVWCWSDDNGQTWTTPHAFDNLTERSCYYVTDCIATNTGLLACDATFPPTAAGNCYSQVWQSADGGKTWSVLARLTEPEENMGDETALLETEPGTILCLLRHRQGQGTLRLWSRDGGRTWSQREDLGPMIGVLQRPFLTRLDAKTILLTGRDQQRRLVVAYVSRDNGQTFGERQVLDGYQADGAYTSACPTGTDSVLLTWYTDQGTAKGYPDIKTAALRVLNRPTMLWMNLSRELPAGEALYVYYANREATSAERRAWAWTDVPHVVEAKLVVEK